LVVEIQGVGDQLVQVDFRRAFKPASLAAAAAFIAALTPAAFPAIAMGGTTPAFAASAFPVSSFLLLLWLSHSKPLLFREYPIASRLLLSFLADLP
jgi:hypothetical protein